MPSDTIRISIGTEPNQYLACEVLKSSIVRRTSRPVAFTESWAPESGWHPQFISAPRVKQGTRFSAWRWLVPKLYANSGRAIYLDADQVVVSDIGELWDTLEPPYLFAAVINAVGVFGKKTPELNHVQTSVMVMDCERCNWPPNQLLAKVGSGVMAYRDLMQATWIPREAIQELDPAWNHFGIHDDRTKLIHWSHVASQPWRKNVDHPTAWIFRRELMAALSAGHISQDAVFKEIARGHVHESYAP